MYMYPFLLFILLITARENSTYHPHLLFKRYVIIKNKTLSNLLIGQSDPVNISAKNAKANRNKLTYSGIVFYGLFLLLCCFSVIMALLPDFPCESFIFNSRAMFFKGNTLNEILPFIFALTLSFLGGAFEFINTSKYAAEKKKSKKFTYVLYYSIAIMFSTGAIGTLWMAITAII